MRGALAVALALALSCSSPPANPANPAPKNHTPPGADHRERTPPLDDLFGQKLPRWVVALNSNGADAAAADRAVTAAAASLPADARAHLATVLDAARDAHRTPDAALNDASDKLDDEVAALDRALSAGGLGYQLDASVITTDDARQVLLFSFAVDRVRRYRSGSAGYDALWVTRLDQLAFDYRLVGLAAERRDAMVLTAQVDSWLRDEILPVVAEPERWREGRERASSELPATIGAALTAELGLVAGADNLSKLLADPELHELDAQIAFGKIRELAIAGIEHHEIQHQIDAAAGLRGLDGLEPAEVVARRELSAYLAEVARNRRGTHLAVVKLAGFALSPTAAELERAVASSIITNLAAQLGGSADSGGAEALSVATALILLRDRESVARAAARLWSAYFGGPLAELQLERSPDRTAKRFRAKRVQSED